MDRIKNKRELPHSDISEKIIGCCFEVMKELGKYIADLIVENLIIVELKCCKLLLAEDQAQVINYLKASEKPVGLLVNFGNPKLEYKRLHHPDNFMELEECSSGLLTFLKPYAENKSLDSSSCPS